MAECKFKCRSKTEYDDGLANAHMEPVQDCEENRKFFKHAPSGFLDLSGISPDVASMFKAGKSYIIKITEMEE